MENQPFNFKIAATVSPITDNEQYAAFLVKASLPDDEIEEARSGPLDKEGKPRMLHLTAWIVHEGRNLNGAAFIKEELEKRVRESLFAPPYMGMIDFNHDQIPIGAWYDASFAYHQEANKWGILARGAIWAWRFEDLSNKLMATMFEEGYIEVSMACLPESEELVLNYPGAEGEYTFILHNPIFFTTSVLDVPPADPDARGVAEVTEKKADVVPAELHLAAGNNNQEEEIMDELEMLKEKFENAQTQINDLNTKIEELSTAATAKEEEYAASVQVMTEEHETLKAQLSGLETKKSELEVALSSSKEVVGELEAKIESLTTELDEFKAQEIARKKEETLEARMNELPKVVRTNLDAHPDKDTIVKAWAEMSEEDWESTKRTMTLANQKISYGERSEREGPLPSFGDDNKGSSLSRFIQ